MLKVRFQCVKPDVQKSSWTASAFAVLACFFAGRHVSNGGI
jgi:hypothetical protein